MEVVSNSYMPGDPRLIQQLVYELKSQGIFDQFRKECIADVDTKPAYQNLRQRVEGSVATFLKQQTWRPDMNKNQVREQLRKTIYESGYIDTGVERIVDQVVNPKINTVFLPQVEDVVYRYLGIEKPNKLDVKKELKIDVSDLLPTDLEAVSPESDHTDKRDDSINLNDSLNMDPKLEEDESPPFEPLDDQPGYIPQEENSVDSHLSGFSGLQSHESNHESDTRVCQMELSNQDSHTSHNSSESHLSIVTSEENTKMEICEDSDSRLIKTSDSECKPDISNETHFNSDKSTPKKELDEYRKDKQDKKIESDKPTEQDKKEQDKNSEQEKNDKVLNEDKQVSEKKNDKKLVEKKSEEKKGEKLGEKEKSDDKKSKSSEKHGSKDRKEDKYKKITSSSSSSSIRDKDKLSSKCSSSSSSKDRNKSKDKKDSKSGSNKDKSDKSKYDRENSFKEKDKLDKEKEKYDKEKVDKEKEKVDKVKEKVDKEKEKFDKEKSDKEKSEKEKEKSDKDRDRSGREKNKNSSSSNSKHNSNKEKDRSSSRKELSSSSSSNKDKEKPRSSVSKDKSKSSHGNSKTKSDKHKKDDRHSQNGRHSSSSSTASNTKKDKEKKRDEKKDLKDDHYSSKDKKIDRRSTDRDSNDGQSSKQNQSNSCNGSSSSRSQKTSKESSSTNNGSGSGDSGNSDQVEHTTLESPVKALESTENKEVMVSNNDIQKFKYIKPKFASNFQEARKIMKIRKQLARLERQNQLSLAQIEVPTVNGVNEEENDLDDPKTPEIKEKSVSSELDTPKLQSTELSQENWEALEARLAQEMSNVNYNSYESYDDYDYVKYNSVVISPTKNIKVSNDEIDGKLCVDKELDANTVNEKNMPLQNETKLAISEKTPSDEVKKSENENDLLLQKDLICNNTRNIVDKLPQTASDIEKSVYSNGMYNDKKELIEKKNIINQDNETHDQTTFIDEVKIKDADTLKIVISKLSNEVIKKNDSIEKLQCKHDRDDLCRYLEKPSPSLERNLQFIYEFVKKLEKDVEHSIKASQNNFLPARRGRKRKLEENVDFKNNNKAHFEQNTEIKRRRKYVASTLISKANKDKMCNSSDVLPNDNFLLPLSPAESDQSNDKKDEESPETKKKKVIIGRNMNNRTQRYSNDDLYKPRPIFSGSRRNRIINSSEN